jgi:tyrosyl-tRNA synthetase
MKFLGFIRDVGKHITINYMLSKDSVKKRIAPRAPRGEGEGGLSFTEFSYQLIQGYDFLWLYEHKNCKLQLGGSDQWGNITTGTELIRRKTGGEAFGITCPLITKADGGKFGKTETGNIWLDAEKTSPYQFYQFWLNAADSDAEKWIRIFSFLKKEEIESLIAEHIKNASQRILQKRLAKEVTVFVHGEEEYKKAIKTTEKLFAQENATTEFLSSEDLENMEGIVNVQYPISNLKNGTDVVSFLTETEIFPSKGEARKMIQNGGVSINRKKVDDLQLTIDHSILLHKKYLLVQKGKKNYYLVRVI